MQETLECYRDESNLKYTLRASLVNMRENLVSFAILQQQVRHHK